MRKVKFKDYDSEKREWIEGTGVFHQWAGTFEVDASGNIGNFTFGIVEDEGGSVWQVTPHHITFLEPIKL